MKKAILSALLMLSVVTIVCGQTKEEIQAELKTARQQFNSIRWGDAWRTAIDKYCLSNTEYAATVQSLKDTEAELEKVIGEATCTTEEGKTLFDAFQVLADKNNALVNEKNWTEVKAMKKEYDDAKKALTAYQAKNKLNSWSNEAIRPLILKRNKLQVQTWNEAISLMQNSEDEEAKAFAADISAKSEKVKELEAALKVAQ